MKTFLDSSPEKKRSLAQMRVFRIIVRQESAILFLAAFFLVLLFGVRVLLFMEQRDLESSYSLTLGKDGVHTDIARYDEVVARVQKMLDPAEKVVSNQESISWTLALLEQNIPSGISVVLIRVENGTLHLSGTSDTRERLLELQQRLKESQCVTEVMLPWSQIAQKENIHFDVTISLDPKCFKKSL